jgi:hypothetical protein
VRAKYIYNCLNEKFTEDSDPIKDLGIGMIKFWKEKTHEIGSNLTINNRKIYFYDGDDGELMIFWDDCSQIMYQVIKAASEKENVQTIFDRWSKEYLIGSKKDNIVKRKKIAEVLKDQFHIYVNPLTKYVNKRISE